MTCDGTSYVEDYGFRLMTLRDSRTSSGTSSADRPQNFYECRSH